MKFETLSPTLSPALNSCPSVCRQLTGNTRDWGRSSAAEGSLVAEGVGGQEQGVFSEGKFQRFTEGGVQTMSERPAVSCPGASNQQT